MKMDILDNPQVQTDMDDIADLDFEMIKRKLQDPDEGQGWSKEFCDDTEVEYKRF